MLSSKDDKPLAWYLRAGLACGIVMAVFIVMLAMAIGARGTEIRQSAQATVPILILAPAFFALRWWVVHRGRRQ